MLVTSTAPADYQFLTEDVIEFDEGTNVSTIVCVIIATVSDTLLEEDEVFTVEFTFVHDSSHNVTKGIPSTQTLTILNSGGEFQYLVCMHRRDTYMCVCVYLYVCACACVCVTTKVAAPFISMFKLMALVQYYHCGFSKEKILYSGAMVPFAYLAATASGGS